MLRNWCVAPMLLVAINGLQAQDSARQNPDVTVRSGSHIDNDHDSDDDSTEIDPDLAFEELVVSGQVRPARSDEIDQWFRVAPRSRMRQSRDSLRYQTFVILRPVELPRGMYGAHSRIFIVPKGVPVPRGFTRSHNTFLLMDSGACMGPGCG